MKIKFHFWYKNNHEDEVERDVEFVPDRILYKKIWWKKEESAIDFDDGTYTKVHYVERCNF